ncbi:hypothetical protein [Sulfuricurvum sp.]|uniref:hypothetical protein n=1 Tax=Sulfuricurvum sp. TaxID=2025608 RepID=UPI00261F7FED|nr:hypothetical protein [Sulfuricurvum sp.]MDD3597196.1 hypothetical protein [Sulfuricurvum sp.]
MKKLILTIFLCVSLLGSDLYFENNVSQNTSLTTEEQQEVETAKSSITTTDVVGAIATPLFVAGAIVTAVVVSPIWLAKKLFGSEEK